MTEKPDNADPRSTRAWRLLEKHAAQTPQSLDRLLARDGRFYAFSSQVGDLFFDFSRYRASDETRELLLQLADECELGVAIERMFNGEQVNASEGRAALHTSLRDPACAVELDEVDIAGLVERERKRFLAYADGVRSGVLAGFTGQAFTRVINIGIGGSDLGPRMLATALGSASAQPETVPEVLFVSGIDGIELQNALQGADPATTLFVVCSKTFTTLETRSNADAAREWLLNSLPPEAVATNFAAISANLPEVENFGLTAENCFAIWDWVGGRYSLWSAIGLAAAIRLGSEAFLQLLAGAAAMDEHFRTAPFADNIPVTLGLLGVWNRNFLGLEHHVVLPYDQRLEYFPAYLQQLFMESEGKLVRADGNPVDYMTGTALWGGVGSNAQHSYAQWLHQGAAKAHVDFIATVNGPDVISADAHLQSLANLIAQAEALAYGQDEVAVKRGLKQGGEQYEPAASLVAQKVHPGNRSSLIVLLRELNPFNLGMLIALYEHEVYVQSVIWGINPFDQWGVELGKQRARQFAASLLGDTDANGGDLPELGRQILRWRTD